MTTKKDIFIERVSNKFGDKLDFKKTDYTNSHNYVTVTCKKHGDFKIKAYSLLTSKYGCKKCYFDISSKEKKYSLQEFLDKINSQEKDIKIIDEYKGYEDKHRFLCKKHGQFISTPHMVSSNKYGCPKCGKQSAAEKNRKTLEQFINEAKNIHGNKFSYKKTIYKNNKTKIEIECKKHGSIFVTPQDHLRGHGCFYCSKKYMEDSYVIDICKKVHNNEYNDYSIDKNKISFKCKKHGVVVTNKISHINGVKCGKCAKLNAGYSKGRFVSRCGDKMGIFYIVKLTNNKECFFKVGITSMLLSDRFRSIPYDYDVILFIQGSPEYIYDLEKKYIHINKNNKYKPIKKFSGSTECFEYINKPSE